MRDEKHLLFRGVRKPFCKMLKHLSLWPRGEGGFIPQVSERAAPGIPSHPDPPHAHSRTHTCPAGVVTMVSLAYILPQLLAKSLFSRTLSAPLLACPKTSASCALHRPKVDESRFPSPSAACNARASQELAYKAIYHPQTGNGGRKLRSLY